MKLSVLKKKLTDLHVRITCLDTSDGWDNEWRLTAKTYGGIGQLRHEFTFHAVTLSKVFELAIKYAEALKELDKQHHYSDPDRVTKDGDFNALHYIKNNQVEYIDELGFNE